MDPSTTGVRRGLLPSAATSVRVLLMSGQDTSQTQERLAYFTKMYLYVLTYWCQKEYPPKMSH